MRKTKNVKIEINVSRGCNCWDKHRSIRDRLECIFPNYGLITVGTGKFVVMHNHRDYENVFAHQYANLEEAEIQYNALVRTAAVKQVEIWYMSSRNA